MKVGDYVRNSYYGIGKINGEYDDKNEHWYNVKFAVHDENDEEYHCGICERSIGFKISPNIIDLIEVGDYVNGYLVYEIKENCIMVGYKCFKTEFDNEEDFLYQTIYANNIKSIVTKEQFESMEYRIGD